MTARSGMMLAIAIELFDHAPLRLVGAAFLDLDDVEVPQPEAAAGRGGALAEALCKLTLGTLLHPADGGDHDTHDGTAYRMHGFRHPLSGAAGSQLARRAAVAGAAHIRSRP